jgi:hypothetical protein
VFNPLCVYSWVHAGSNLVLELPLLDRALETALARVHNKSTLTR